MYRKRQLLATLIASAMVAACGGGSDPAPEASVNTAPATSATPANTTPTPTTTAPATTGNTSTGATPPATEPVVTAPVTPPPPPPPPPVVDQQFKGIMELVSNQLVYLRVNRVIYLPITLSEFEGPTGIVDIASGSPVANLPNLEAEAKASGCTIAVDGTCGIQPSAVAPAAPIAQFGLRIGNYLLSATPGEPVGKQTVVGRIAFDLTERADSPGVGGGSGAEIMRFIIDNVEMSTDDKGDLISVKVKDGGQLHVYGRNAAGVEVRDSFPAPAGTVRLLPLNEIPDGKGDTTSTILFVDLETGFSRVGDKLAALQSIAGHFDMNVTISTVEKINRPAAADTPGFPAVPRKDLIGKTITVNTQPPVSGGGISGSAWIRMYPR